MGKARSSTVPLCLKKAANTPKPLKTTRKYVNARRSLRRQAHSLTTLSPYAARKTSRPSKSRPHRRARLGFRHQTFPFTKPGVSISPASIMNVRMQIAFRRKPCQTITIAGYTTCIPARADNFWRFTAGNAGFLEFPIPGPSCETPAAGSRHKPAEAHSSRLTKHRAFSPCFPHKHFYHRNGKANEYGQRPPEHYGYAGNNYNLYSVKT